METERVKWLVISDLDGSLLNHFDYGFDAALPALQELRDNHIPVILNTSKTYYETVEIRTQLQNDSPFIVENGSCLYLPKKSFPELPSQFAESRDDFWAIKLGSSIEEINRYLEQVVTDKDPFTLLTACSPSQVSELTGLSDQEAENALKREFSQPFLWQGHNMELDLFIQRLARQGLTVLQGGRFLHIQGKTNKGQAINKLKSFYSKLIKTVVIGDSANDIAMLEIADMPIVINAPGNVNLLEAFTPFYRTKSPAPKGWSEAIEYFFKNH